MRNHFFVQNATLIILTLVLNVSLSIKLSTSSFFLQHPWRLCNRFYYLRKTTMTEASATQTKSEILVELASSTSEIPHCYKSRSKFKVSTFILVPVCLWICAFSVNMGCKPMQITRLMAGARWLVALALHSFRWTSTDCSRLPFIFSLVLLFLPNIFSLTPMRPLFWNTLVLRKGRLCTPPQSSTIAGIWGICCCNYKSFFRGVRFAEYVLRSKKKLLRKTFLTCWSSWLLGIQHRLLLLSMHFVIAHAGHSQIWWYWGSCTRCCCSCGL